MRRKDQSYRLLYLFSRTPVFIVPIGDHFALNLNSNVIVRNVFRCICSMKKTTFKLVNDLDGWGVMKIGRTSNRGESLLLDSGHARWNLIFFWCSTVTVKGTVYRGRIFVILQKRIVLSLHSWSNKPIGIKSPAKIPKEHKIVWKQSFPNNSFNKSGL